MRLIAASLALPVGLGVAPATGRQIVRSVLAAKTLVARPCLDQRAVHREVLPGQQALLVRQGHDFSKERFHDFVLEQSVAVLREDGVVPHHVLHCQSDKPAEEQVVLHLLHQHALAAHRVEHLQQQSTHQFLR